MTRYLAELVGVGCITAVVMVVATSAVITEHPITAAIIIIGTLIMFLQIVRLAKKLETVRDGVKGIADIFDRQTSGYEPDDDEHDGPYERESYLRDVRGDR